MMNGEGGQASRPDLFPFNLEETGETRLLQYVYLISTVFIDKTCFPILHLIGVD